MNDLESPAMTTADYPEGWFRTLVDQSRDILAVIDDTGVIQFKSPAIEQRLGYDPDALIGENALGYVHPDDRSQVEEAITPVIDGPQGRSDPYEYRFRHTDGSWLWFESIVTDCTDTVLDGYIVNSRDITDRKQRARRYTAIFNQTFQFTGLMEPDGTLIEANETALTFGGLDRVDVIGTKIWESAWFQYGDAAERARKAVERARDGEFVREEVEVQGADRTAIIDFSVRPVVDDTGEVELLVPEGRDITERVEAERALKRQNEQLEAFADVLSHDLRNPLNVAEGRLELVRQECDSEHFDDIEWAISRCQTLVDDLLTLARDGAGVDELESVDLTEAGRVCWTAVETGDATLRLDTTQTIQADRSRLHQLLENLFRNAIEHGGQDVTVTVGDQAELSGFYVEDDGPGIPQAERERVFEGGYSATEDGTGLGLAIVKEIAEAHNWALDVADGSDGGARFELTGVTRVD